MAERSQIYVFPNIILSITMKCLVLSFINRILIEILPNRLVGISFLKLARFLNNVMNLVDEYNVVVSREYYS